MNLRATGTGGRDCLRNGGAWPADARLGFFLYLVLDLVLDLVLGSGSCMPAVRVTY